MTDSKKQADMPDPKNASRRKAVKTIVGGVSALAAYNLAPTNWSKPLIEQVFLPAHAGTSGTTLNDPCSIRVRSGDRTTNDVVVRVQGFVTPATGGLATTIVGTPTPGGAANSATVNTTTQSDGTFSADLTLTNGPGIRSVAVVTTVTGASGSATCSVAIPAGTPAPTPTATGTVVN